MTNRDFWCIVGLFVVVALWLISWMALEAPEAVVEVTYDAGGQLVAVYHPPQKVHAHLGELHTIFTADGAKHLAVWPQIQERVAWPTRERRLKISVSPEWIRQTQERHETNAILSFMGNDEDGGSI